ncbi:hypothetical protein ACFFOS_10760 [Nocardioides kongjuensis]|uniref:ElaB/YqjD/DUF883 family membrane-anchored ribosome-binding protein n=1 Tax=Nocardioides kongjuensis TaxID=349522 RepID=A0A852RQG2_9ACTN|nr:hypothetical protein [Nocardioides kongjuensis]NYD31486.1 ElaB/YqjD/DUF883 family membrane-anchored ribosome-binding protein [Nocardioides kongjuensis]
MATKTKKNDKQVTDYISGLVDTTKDLLDDPTTTAGDIEKKARKNGKKATKAVVPSKKDINGLRDQIKDLSKQAEKLAKVGKSNKK